MTFPVTLLVAMLGFLLSGSFVMAQENQPVDWLQGHVTVKARGYAKMTGSPIDSENAIDAAKVVAQAELLEAIKGVMVDSQTAVSDLMTERTETSVKVRGVLHGATLVGEPLINEDKGFVVAIVEMRICLFANGKGCKSDRSLTSVLPKSTGKKRNKSEVCNLLPNIKSTQEILSKVTYDTNEPLRMFVINLGGSPYNAEYRDMVIGYEAGNGQKCSVYSPDKVDPVIRRDRGIVETFFHLADVERKYGPNIIITAAKSIDSNNYIVIDSNDAYLLNLLNERARNSVFNEAKIGISLSN